ncbi:N-acetyltransferase, partial [Arthrobacter deserti]|nr:N-acetyltransferase [Arthrobacter deserti]
MQHPRLTIREVPWSNPVGADLRAAQQSELNSRFGTTDHEPGPPPSAEDMPVFLLAYEKSSGQPLGCGGLRELDKSTAEIKRVYVVPYARGSGVSGAILAA